MKWLNAWIQHWRSWLNSPDPIKAILSAKQTWKWLCAFFVLQVVVNAWLCDDAFISFRCVDNAINGYGLTYNVGQRLQVFTNALQVLLLLPIHAIFHGFGIHAIFFESIALSYLCLVFFTFVIIKVFKTNRQKALFFLFLSIHYTVVDFFTSGLENGLNFLLVFWLVYSARSAKWALGAFIAGLLVVSRLDMALLVLPFIIWLLLNKKHQVSCRIKYLLAFGLPIFLWLAFAIVYYGSALPNSVIAKTSFKPQFQDIPLKTVDYLIGTTYHEPLAFLLPIILLVCMKPPKGYLQPLLIGGILYFVFPPIGGGDYMAGRFQGIPIVLFSAIILLSGYYWARLKPFVLICALFFIFHPGNLWIYTKTKAPLPRTYKGISNEKWRYFTTNSLLFYARYGELPFQPYRAKGKSYRKVQKPMVITTGIAGMPGYFAGPLVTIYDPFGIVDPIAARLPISTNAKWRPGHAKRREPEGYLKTIKTGENHIQDPAVSALYEDLVLATKSTDWFSKKRWEAIWRLNTNYHHIPRDYQ